MPKKGYFILRDISGYTKSLTKSGPDHAQDALQNLFDVQFKLMKRSEHNENQCYLWRFLVSVASAKQT
jgi:hypothetical protein